MASKYTYGTAEYKLEQAREKLDEALAAVEKLRVETVTAKPLEIIKLKGGNTSNYPNSFVEWNQPYRYESFDPLKEEHIERSYKAAMDWHAMACKQLEHDHAANLPIIENNKKVIENVQNFMTLNGIAPSYSKSHYKCNKWVSETIRAGYLGDIEHYCKTSDGYNLIKMELSGFLDKTESWRKEKLSKIAIAKREKEKTDKELRKIAKAMELAEKLGVIYANNEELLSKVEEASFNKWMEDHPDIDIDDINGNFFDGYDGF